MFRENYRVIRSFVKKKKRHFNHNLLVLQQVAIVLKQLGSSFFSCLLWRAGPLTVEPIGLSRRPKKYEADPWAFLDLPWISNTWRKVPMIVVEKLGWWPTKYFHRKIPQIVQFRIIKAIKSSTLVSLIIVQSWINVHSGISIIESVRTVFLINVHSGIFIVFQIKAILR